MPWFNWPWRRQAPPPSYNPASYYNPGAGVPPGANPPGAKPPINVVTGEPRPPGSGGGAPGIRGDGLPDDSNYAPGQPINQYTSMPPPPWYRAHGPIILIVTIILIVVLVVLILGYR